MNRLHTRRIRASRAVRTPVCVAVLAAAFLLALSGVAFADVWTDISDATWQNVYHVSAADASTVAEGFPDGTFRPYQQVTRGQFAKMVTDGLDIPLFDPAVPSFSDVPTNHIFYQHIEGAVAAGVISGYPDDTYRPDNNIMRQQANSILGLWLSDQEIEAIGGIQGADGFYDSLLAWFAAEGDEVLSGFDDRLQIAPVHRPGTAYLVMRGVVLGSSSGATTTLGPLGELSRAQAVTMIVRTRDVVFEADPPTVTNVDPEAGPATGGNSVVITGTGFGGLSGASAVTFGTHNATSYVVDSLTQITAVAPAGVAGTTVDVRVTNTGGTSAVGPADKYTYRTLHIAVTGIADPVTAGTVSTVTLSVVDQADDVVTDYTGTVHFTSNDTAAVLPANYTFKASDAGTHTFTGGVTLKTAGERTVTATDTVTSSITGTQTVTVNHAAAGKVSLETLANGTGTTIDATSVVGGGTVTAYAVTRDTYDNFVENAASAWSLTTKTGGVVNADLVAASDGKSAVFTGHLAGTCKIHAVTTVGAFADDTGTVTVTAGAASKISLETLANGTGTTIDATSVASGGTPLTVYAVKRDAGGNYIANAPSDSFIWTLSNLTPATGGVVGTDLVTATGGQSAVFSGHLVGTCKINAAKTGLITGTTGTITVTPGAATKLAFTTSPSASTAAGTAFAPSPVVTVQDALGNTVTGATTPVTLAFTSGTNTEGATLTGTAIVAAIDGVASFAGLSVNRVGNYQLHATGGSLTAADSTAFSITPKPITGTFTVDATKTYDATTTANVTDRGLTGVMGTDAVTLSGGTATYDTKDVGPAKTVTLTGATLAGADAANYTLSSVATTTAAITAKPITVTPDSGQSKTAGAPDPTFTYVTTPGLLLGDSFTGALGRVAGEGVGTYAITQGTLSAGANYAITFTPNILFTINPSGG